jgi:anti-sigma28 factor (negative regulator of flagellin synthesis)
MRIDPTLVVAPVASETSAAKPRTKRTTKPPASVVAMSSAGAAMVADGDDGDVISPRVETLRMMVEKGDYKVDLDTLASRIVDDEVVRARR